ncbi:MAG: hypothetical protein PHX42_00795 [Candidatus Methanomethylophilaceae archaeon]|nr:hypothetical protein [Candidatus Methanomethylophilaceae archaeon]
MAVLVSLQSKGGRSYASLLVEDVGNYNSVKSAAKRLDEEGLLTISELDSGNILYELTDLGRRVATELKRAEDVLAGLDPEEAMPTDFGASEEKGSVVR